MNKERGMKNFKNDKGFTLIELLVVIGIIVILSVAVVLTLNPAELLRQARDSTRVSDMATVKSALALYLADVSTNITLGDSARCYAQASSTVTGGSACTAGNRFLGGTYLVTSTVLISGNGWIPVDLTQISSGAPISAWITDPVNNASYYYAYRPTNTSTLTYELNAVLESTKYTSGSGNLQQTDGGNQGGQYEVGTDPGLDL